MKMKALLRNHRSSGTFLRSPSNS